MPTYSVAWPDAHVSTVVATMTADSLTVVLCWPRAPRLVSTEPRRNGSSRSAHRSSQLTFVATGPDWVGEAAIANSVAIVEGDVTSALTHADAVSLALDGTTARIPSTTARSA